MVFLRLEVKVFPREQVASSPGLFRSLIGSNGDRARDEVSAPKKFASFLLALEKPEEVTLGDLACMILDEWRVLRPDQEQLAIKKLLDDANPSVDLNVGLTVEDVFVDRGKARSDDHDQRATVRVVQKPTTHCPERLPSVVQDWDGAVQESKRRRSKTEKEAERFSPIMEEDESVKDTAMQDSPIEERFRDIPVSSVETLDTTAAGQQEPTSDAIAGTPLFNRLGSEELGSPSPPQHSASPRERNQRPQSQIRKRKQSPEEDGPVKHPRLEETVTSSHESTQRLTEGRTAQSPAPAAEFALPSISSPLRKRTQTPTFATPRHRRPSTSQKPSEVSRHGLGLGITSSPSEARTAMLDMPPSETSLGSPVLASNVASATTRLEQHPEPAAKRVHSSQSAMRKSMPVSGSYQRRSVSFATGNGIAQDSHDKAQSNHRDSVPVKPSQSSPAPDSGAPSSSQTVYPPGLEDKINKIRAQLEQEARELESVNNKLKDPKTNPRCLPPLKRLSNLLVEIERCKGTDRSTQKLRKLRQKLPDERQWVQKIEQEVMETGRQPSKDPPPPSSASQADGSISAPDSSAPPGLDAAPAWSFGIAGKAESNRRSSAAPSNGTHQSTGSQHPGSGSSRKPGAESKSPVSKSPALNHESSPRESPAKTGFPSTPSVVAQTPPSRLSMEVGESKWPDEQREIIEPAPSDDGDKSEEDQDEGVIEGGDTKPEKPANGAVQSLVDDEAKYQDGNKDVDEEDAEDDGENEEDDEENEEEAESEEHEEDEDEDGDKDESEGDMETTTAEKEAKERVLGLIDGEAKDQDVNEDDDGEDGDDDDDEDEEDEDEDEDEDEAKEVTEEDKDKNHDTAGEEDKKQAMNGFPWQTNEAEHMNDDGDGDESGPELNLFPSPSPPREVAKTPAQAPSQPRSSQSASGIRATLKGLLLSQKAEQAARQEQPQPAGPQPPQRNEVYEVPSSSESDSDSDADSDDDSNQENPGDILPNGDSRKLRRPYSLRE